jgi:hypothetical protein
MTASYLAKQLVSEVQGKPRNQLALLGKKDERGPNTQASSLFFCTALDRTKCRRRRSNEAHYSTVPGNITILRDYPSEGNG